MFPILSDLGRFDFYTIEVVRKYLVYTKLSYKGSINCTLLQCLNLLLLYRRLFGNQVLLELFQEVGQN